MNSIFQQMLSMYGVEGVKGRVKGGVEGLLSPKKASIHRHFKVSVEGWRHFSKIPI